MRQLTQQEIDNRPDGTNFYTINQDGSASFTLRDAGLIQQGHRQVPRKEFDIMDYEFDDPILSVSESSKESIAFNCYTRESVAFTREDWIAGAKHFKLTASDLL